MQSKTQSLFTAIRSWVTHVHPNPSSDADLVRQFAVGRSEAAFADLLDRHGPMVLGVARQIIGDHHAAEDVLQATFLILARKAARLRRPAALPAWLHRTARNIALNARHNAARRGKAEQTLRTPATNSPLDELSSRELLAILDEELQHLPESLRLPLILCCLEGRSQDEAARLLGWTPGSVKGRLERGRQRLKGQLSRRGISFAIGAGVPLLFAAPSIAGVRLATLESVRAGTSASAAVTALLQQALKASWVVRWEIMLISATIGAAGIGFAFALLSGSMWEKEKPPLQAAVGQEKTRPPRPNDIADAIPREPIAHLGAVPFRHEGDALDLTFTPDGKTLIGRTTSGIVFWDATTGKDMRRLPIPLIRGGSDSMAVSPDGTTLAVTEADPTLGAGTKISLWDTRSGLKTRTLQLPKDTERIGRVLFGQSNPLVFTSDGKSLICMPGRPADRRKVVVLDVASGDARATLEEKGSRLYNFALAPDNKTLAAAVYGNHSVQIWDIVSGKFIRTIHKLPDSGIESNVMAIAFSPDGAMLAVSTSNQILLFDAATWKPLTASSSMPGAGMTRRLVFTPDSKKLITIEGLRGIVVREVAGGKVLHTLSDSPPPPNTIALTPDGKAVAAGTRGQSVRFWSLETGEELFPRQGGHDSTVTCLALAPDAKTVVSADLDCQFIFWDMARGQQRRALQSGPDFRRSASLLNPQMIREQTLALSPDGQQLVIIPIGRNGSAPRLRFLEAESGKERRVITVPETQFISSAVFSPDGRKLFTLDFNKERQSQWIVRHWDAATGKQEQEWTAPYRDVAKEGPSGFGGKMVGGLAKKGDVRPTLMLMLASDGKTVFAPKGNNGVSVYDVDYNRQRLLTNREKDGLRFPQLSFAPSHDARLIATWLDDPVNVSGLQAKRPNAVIRLVEVATGKVVLLLKGHESSVAEAAWSRDGRLLATGDRRGNFHEPTSDQAVRLWDAVTGKPLAVFTGFQADVTALSFAPDGTALGAGLRDGSILVWDVSKAKPSMGSAQALARQELEACWTDLGGDDAGKAHQAIWKLVAGPKESVPFLRERLKPATVVDAAKIAKSIADQNSDILAVRQAAARELENAGAQAFRPIQEALKGNPPLETRLRLEQIMNKLDVPVPDTLAVFRAVMVLEKIGSAEARAVLESLANGAPRALQTESAKRSLKRLGKGLPARSTAF